VNKNLVGISWAPLDCDCDRDRDRDRENRGPSDGRWERERDPKGYHVLAMVSMALSIFAISHQSLPRLIKLSKK
jgi:hypothetical protein